MTKRQRVLFLGSSLWAFSEGLFGPLFAVFTEQIGGNLLDVSWAWTIYLVVTGSLIILIGKVSDKKWFSKSYAMYAGYAINALCTFAYLLIRTPTQLFLVGALSGLANALIEPNWNSLFTRYEDKKQSGSAWGWVGGQAQILSGLAVLIGGLIVQYFSFSALFITMGIVQVISLYVQIDVLQFQVRKSTKKLLSKRVSLRVRVRYGKIRRRTRKTRRIAWGLA
ncbi:MAG: MFS transporter [Candidatus Pacebacteria bacterium]|nr:MFS transporter [Candidatus Paceibacterota bacterium]